METGKRPYEETEIDLMEIFQILLASWIPMSIVGTYVIDTD